MNASSVARSSMAAETLTTPNATGSVSTTSPRASLRPDAGRIRRHVFSSRVPIARLACRAVDEGRSACSSASSRKTRSIRSWLIALQARSTAGPSDRPRFSMRHASIHARRSSAVAISPDAVAASRPSECANPPSGNRLSQRCSSASRGAPVVTARAPACVDARRRRRRHPGLRA